MGFRNRHLPGSVKAEHMTLPDGTYPVTVEEAAGVLKERHAGRAEAKGAAKADKKRIQKF